MGDTSHGCTQADQEHEGQHQVAAGRVAGACRHGAAPRHAAAVGVENLWGRGGRTFRGKQRATGLWLRGLTDPNQLGQS